PVRAGHAGPAPPGAPAPHGRGPSRSRSLSEAARSAPETKRAALPVVDPFRSLSEAARSATETKRPAPASHLLDGRDLHEQLLDPARIKPHVRDPLRTFAGDRVDAPFAEIVMTNPVARAEFEVAVIAQLGRDAV